MDRCLRRVESRSTHTHTHTHTHTRTHTQATAGAGDDAQAEAAKSLSRVLSKDDFGRMVVLGQLNLGFIIGACGRGGVVVRGAEACPGEPLLHYVWDFLCARFMGRTRAFRGGAASVVCAQVFF